MKFFKQLWHLFLHDIHLVIASAIAVYYVSLHLLEKINLLPPANGHERDVALQGVFVLFMVMVLFLVINELRRSYERLNEEDNLERCNATLRRIAEDVFDKKVALRSRPTRHEDYTYLWGGYTGTYDVYNPSYHLEEGAGWSRVIQLMVERYNSRDFEKARYLFLTGDLEGEVDFKKFRDLMVSVKESCSDLVSKIEVKVNSRERVSPAAEMYLGTRDWLRTAILELRDGALGPSHGKPHYYLIVHDAVVIDQFLQKHFNEAWDSADAVSFDIFKKEMGSEKGPEPVQPTE